MKVDQSLRLFAVLAMCAAQGVFIAGVGNQVVAADETEDRLPTLAEVKAAGALRSSFKAQVVYPQEDAVPQANLELFQAEIRPALRRACMSCHGSETQEAEFRIDTLNPDLLYGNDTAWWLEVVNVLSTGTMPPEGEVELSDAIRIKIIDWLSSEIRAASQVRRNEQGHSSFRRMTRYEYNYVLQDLLGLPYDFAKDLPPDTISEDGFQNSSDVLPMSGVQLAYYREVSRDALLKATVQGARPKPVYWAIPMQAVASQMRAKHDADTEKKKLQLKGQPEKLKLELKKRTAQFLRRPSSGSYFKDLNSGEMIKASWNYLGARYAWPSKRTPANTPEASSHVAIIPARQRLIVELGNTVPDSGTLRVRIRASRASADSDRIPSLGLEFGWQASNNSSASTKISNRDVAILAPPNNPQFYQWDVPLSEIDPRNPMRRTAKLGDTPNPSEYLKIVNKAVSSADVQIDYVEVIAPVYEQWPPKSHARIFVDRDPPSDEDLRARRVLESFMPRAWRRDITESEIDQKLKLFAKLRPECASFQESMIEVLATVLASPKFLYLVRSDHKQPSESGREHVRLTDYELATRLSMFLWCSLPDEELLSAAATGKLSNSEILINQTLRMLADPRSQRFTKHFVRGWLGLELLDYLEVDKKAYPQFDSSLKEAMQEEPIALFNEVLHKNRSVMDFIHADYTLVDERLAKHYGLSGVYGNHFRSVPLADDRRGGILTQAGLLAMNSDGKDSHPLKRGIWLLESLLNDPPPPPPPAVPEIDLADPEIAKLTLKQRLEDHRNDPACMSCHMKIDPWGIAFENFDAVGSWRDEIKDARVDASSLLFNKQEIDGIDGLKRFLLANRQDQFARAMVHKLTTYALGRPLTFGDRAEVDIITTEFRKQNDQLRTLVALIVTSDLFQSK